MEKINGKDLFKLNGFLVPHPSTSCTSPLIYRGDIFEPVPKRVHIWALLSQDEASSELLAFSLCCEIEQWEQIYMDQAEMIGNQVWGNEKISYKTSLTLNLHF